MGRIDLIEGDWHAAVAALDWQVDLGVDTAVQDAPINRYEAGVEAPAPTNSAPPAMSVVAAPGADAVAVAVAMAARATTLPALRDALADYPHCEIRLGARNLVFSAGTVGARVMVVGEAPDIDDDRQGTPFAGAKGTLLDRMFAAIGLARDAGDMGQAIYLTCVLPWKPPGDRAPDAAELAMIRPFLMQHIALAGPQIVVAMGSAATAALSPDAVLSRGGWGQVLGRPLLAMQHPAALLRTPAQKREAWADLLTLQARLGASEATT
jgi:uracil-DNA glycosylase family 4